MPLSTSEMFDFLLSLLENDFLPRDFVDSDEESSSFRCHNDSMYPKARDMKYKHKPRLPRTRGGAPLHPFETFSHFCDRIERNDPNLTVVEFRNEFLNVQRLAHAIAKNSCIVELNLIQSIRHRETRDSRPRSASSHDVLHLCMEGLRHNTSIESLDLTETTVRPTGAAFVSRGLHRHPRLRQLRLSRCLLQDEGLRRLAAAPLGQKLEELDLSGNSLADGAAFLQVVLQNPHLTKLDLSNNAMNAKGVDQFVGFGGFHTLTICDMSRNNIRHDAVQSLGNALADKDCQLKELYLDANEMMDSSMESIAFGLLTNASLKKLSLTHNYLGDVGAVQIAESIGMNPNSRIQDLRFSGNKIHNSGAISLMSHSTTKMVRLDLAGNCISDGHSLCKLLRRGETFLRKLSLSRNPIPLQHTREIEFWTRLNASGGRQLLCFAGNNKQSGEAMAVWPRILSRVSNSPNGIYYFLVRKPELCTLASTTEPIEKFSKCFEQRLFTQFNAS